MREPRDRIEKSIFLRDDQKYRELASVKDRGWGKRGGGLTRGVLTFFRTPDFEPDVDDRVAGKINYS